MSSVKKNLSWNMLLTVSGYLFPLITFPYITRVLGADHLGLANFAMSIVDYAILFSTLGLTSIGSRYIPQCNDDATKRNSVFNHLVTIHVFLSLAILIVYTVCVFSFSRLYEQKTLYFVGILKILTNVFLVEWLFKGMQDFKYITIRTLVIRIIYVFAIFLLVRNKDDYDIYFYVTIAHVVVNSIVNWRYSKKYVDFNLSIKGCKEYLFPVFSMGVNRILLSFYFTFNIIYLGIKCSDANVGYFVTATKIYGIILSILNAYNGVFVPYLNSLLGKGEMEKYKHYVNNSFSIVSLLSIPLIIGSYMLAPEIIRLMAGNNYDQSILPFRIIIIQVLFVGFAQILENQILLSLKKFKEVLVCTTLSSFLAIIILLIFVPKYAEVASAYSVAIPHFFELVLLYFYSKKFIDIRLPYKELIINTVICLPIVFTCIVLKCFSINVFIILIVAGCVSVVYYFILQYYVIKNSFLRSQVAHFLNK